MKYAIIQSGGNQYRCEEGAIITVQRVSVPANTEHTFNEVLLVANDGEVKIGTPHVGGATVQATCLGEMKGPKAISFRYKPKERQRSKRGHRQIYTQFKITSISA